MKNIGIQPEELSVGLARLVVAIGNRITIEHLTYGSMEFVYAYSAAAVAKGDHKFIGFTGLTTAVYNPAATTPVTCAIAMEVGVCMYATSAAGGVWLQTKGQCPFAKLDGGTDVALGDGLQLVTAAVYAIKDAVAGTVITADTYAISLIAETRDLAAQTAAGKDIASSLIYLLGRSVTIG